MQPTRGAGDPPSVQVSAAVPAFIAARFCAPAEGRVGAGVVYTSADGRYLAVVYNDSDSSSKRRRPFESRRRSRSWRVTTGSGSSTTRDAREDYFDAVVNCRAYCRLTSLNVTQMISESTAGFTRATLC